MLILLALVVIDGNRRTATPAASGDSFPGPKPTTFASDILRVATFNIAGGVGKADNRLDLDRTARAIAGYDLVGLEEIHGAAWPGGKDQAQILGESLKLPYLFAPVETRWWKDDFGNGAISSLPVLHWQRFPLSNAGADTNRNILLLKVQFQNKPLNVLITHLGRHVDHDAELHSVIDLFESLEQPVILMGDLNSTPDDPRIKTLRARPGVADPIGDALGNHPGGNLDWIFARGLRSVRSGFTDNGASDHLLAWAEFKVQ